MSDKKSENWQGDVRVVLLPVGEYNIETFSELEYNTRDESVSICPPLYVHSQIPMLSVLDLRATTTTTVKIPEAMYWQSHG